MSTNKQTSAKESDVGQRDLFTVMNQTSDIVINDHDYGVLTKRIKEKIDDVFNNYLSIGSLLLEVKDKKIYELNNYKNIYDYASSEFDLSNTTTKNVINIVKRFCDEDGYLLEKYLDYSFSNLVELLPVADSDIDKFQPSMSVKSVRDKKNELEINKLIEKEFKNDGVLTKLITDVESFDFNKHLKTTGYHIEHLIEREKYTSKDTDYYDDKYYFNVNFSLINKKSILTFYIQLNIEKKQIKFLSEDVYFWDGLLTEYSQISYILKKLCERFIVVGKVLTQEKNKNKSLSNSDSTLDVSPGYHKLKRKYHTHSDTCSSLDFVNLFLSQLDNDYYYESVSSYDYSIIIYASGKRHKTKNPPLFGLKCMNDPMLTTISIYDDKGEIKESFSVFEGIENLMSTKIEMLKEIIK